MDHGEESAARAREDDKPSTESTSSSTESAPSSPSSSPSSVPPSDGGADGLDGQGSLVAPGVVELNGLELRSPKPKPSLGVSV